jgi:CBS-domain-containing membrane protein
MSLTHLYSTDVFLIEPDVTIQNASEQFRNWATTDLIIVKNTQRGPIPLGILRDRDLVIEVLGQNIDITAVTVGDLIKDPSPVVLLNGTTADAIYLMTDLGLRAVPVIDDDGYLMGILRVEDLLAAIIQEIGAVSNILRKEPRRHFI